MRIVEQILDNRQRVIDLPDELLARLAFLHLGQRRQRQACGLQRLQHIVADGSKKTRLDTIGAFGDIARTLEIEVGTLQLREGILELLGARLGLGAERDGRLEQRRGVFRLAQGTFDAAHQRAIDPRQPFDVLIGGFSPGCLLIAPAGINKIHHSCSGPRRRHLTASKS